HRTEFRTQKKRHRTAAKPAVEEKEQGADRGKDRRSARGAINRQDDREHGCDHGRARRLGNRMSGGGMANHPAPYCEKLTSSWQAAPNRESVVSINVAEAIVSCRPTA